MNNFYINILSDSLFNCLKKLNKKGIIFPKEEIVNYYIVKFPILIHYLRNLFSF